MKKKILMCLCAVCLIMPCMCGLVACNVDEFDAYISVSGIETEYIVGQELDLSNAVLEYHTSEDNSEFVIVTTDMVAWHGTATAGEYDMNIIYEGEKITIDYIVYDNALMTEMLINTLRMQDVIQETCVIHGDDREVEYVSLMKKDAEYTFIKRYASADKLVEDYYWVFFEKDEGLEEIYHYSIVEDSVVGLAEKSIYDCDPSADDFGVGIEGFINEKAFDKVENNIEKTLTRNANGTYTLLIVETYGNIVCKNEFVIKNKF